MSVSALRTTRTVKTPSSKGFAPTNDATGKQFKTLKELKNFSAALPGPVYVKNTGSFSVKVGQGQQLRLEGFNAKTPFTALYPRGGDKSTVTIGVKNGRNAGTDSVTFVVMTTPGQKKVESLKVKLAVAYSAS